MRLRAQVHSQTARLSVISGDERRQENMRRRSHDLANSLTGLERDISKLRAQRDMTLAEVEELNARRNRWVLCQGFSFDFWVASMGPQRTRVRASADPSRAALTRSKSSIEKSSNLLPPSGKPCSARLPNYGRRESNSLRSRRRWQQRTRSLPSSTRRSLVKLRGCRIV